MLKLLEVLDEESELGISFWGFRKDGIKLRNKKLSMSSTLIYTLIYTSIQKY